MKRLILIFALLISAPAFAMTAAERMLMVSNHQSYSFAYDAGHSQVGVTHAGTTTYLTTVGAANGVYADWACPYSVSAATIVATGGSGGGSNSSYPGGDGGYSAFASTVQAAGGDGGSPDDEGFASQRVTGVSALSATTYRIYIGFGGGGGNTSDGVSYAIGASSGGSVTTGYAGGAYSNPGGDGQNGTVTVSW